MNQTGQEKIETQAEDVIAAPDRREEEAQQAAQQEDTAAAENMLLDAHADDEILDAPEEGPQRPPPIDPEAAYGYADVDDDDNYEQDNNIPSIGFDTLPPELASSPPGECDPDVQARVARWLELQRDGRRLTDTLRASRDYRNPEFFKKMVEYWEINEHGTAFPLEIFNPSGLPEEDTIEALKKEWAQEDERKKAAKTAGTAKIEFTQGGGGGGGSKAAATATATAAAIKAAQAMAAKLAANRGGQRPKR